MTIKEKNLLDPSNLANKLNQSQDATLKLYIFRHGETEDNLANVLCCDETVLTEKGIKQAEQLRDELAPLDLPIIYASPLPRALKTAQIVASANQTPIEIIPDLREHIVGETAGIPQPEGTETEQYPEMFTILKIGDLASDELKNYGAESKKEARERFYKALLSLKETCPYAMAGVATHSHVMRNLYHFLYGEDRVFKNCDYFILDI